MRQITELQYQKIVGHLARLAVDEGSGSITVPVYLQIPSFSREAPRAWLPEPPFLDITFHRHVNPGGEWYWGLESGVEIVRNPDERDRPSEGYVFKN